MKKYTQYEFEAIVRDEDGCLRLPTGDYSDIDFARKNKIIFADKSILGNYCELGDECMLGDECALGNWCKLGIGCKLGYRCVLGNWCLLGNWCVLGERCKLGNDCVLGNDCELGNGCGLGNGCILGNGCVLGDRCYLGDGCVLGLRCRLGSGCTLEGGRVQNAAYYIVTNIGSRNDAAYAYCDTETGDIYVRAGCWFGGIDEFIARVHEVHAGTQHETDYIAFAEFARARFGRYKNDAHQDI